MKNQKLDALDVLIKVEAFGLNFADVMARKGMYAAAPPIPSVLGYDVVGEVVESRCEERKEPNWQTGCGYDAFWRVRRIR